MPAARPVAPAAPSSPRRESALGSLDGVCKRFSMCLLRRVAASSLPRRGSRGSADNTGWLPAADSPSIDGSRRTARPVGSPAWSMSKRCGARSAERRDELVALVRELVSHRSENPKLLGEPGAGARDRGRGGLPGRRRRAARGARHGRSTASRRCRAATTSSAGSRGAGGGRSLILNGHVDVVPAGDAAAWPHDPWAASSRAVGCGAAAPAT